MAHDDSPRSALVQHPNRDTAAAKIVRALVALLLVISAVLLLVVLVGGYRVVGAMMIVSVLYILLYLVIAFFVLRWQRGMLPVAAGLATIVGINIGISIPAWTDRNASGYTIDTADPVLLATLCAVFVIVQALLIACALYGFRQQWQVEVEVEVDRPL